MNNAELYRHLMQAQAPKFQRLFERHTDLQGLLTYLGDGNNTQALGVLGELRSMLTDCFQGVFRQRPKQGNGFSIRRAVRQKQRQAVFIEYDISLGESMTPIYRLLVDLALKEALGQGAQRGNTFFFLDELKLLPKITHLEDALNFGRSKGVCVMAGLQSVDQIYALYGRERGQAIMGGFGSLFAFRTSDADSRDYVTRLLGTNVMGYRYYNLMDQPIERERDGNTVESWEQRALKTGEAIISLSSQAEPFYFLFDPEA